MIMQFYGNVMLGLGTNLSWVDEGNFIRVSVIRFFSFSRSNGVICISVVANVKRLFEELNRNKMLLFYSD